MKTPESDHLANLGAILVIRRRMLQLTQDQAAEACGIARATYRSAEGGRPLRDMNYDKIDAGMQMPAGSCQSVLGGTQSITLDDGTTLTPPLPSEGSRVPEELFEDVEAGVLVAMAEYAPTVPLGDARKVAELVVNRLKKKF
ncbi:hypothetical protein [Streptomyces sp. NPDC018055]|uniref:hypothetical protein n=1 Tax=Streptomyces sp. NPDC018055 TaxID=3365038 RepID=UPI003799B00F